MDAGRARRPEAADLSARRRGRGRAAGIQLHPGRQRLLRRVRRERVGRARARAGGGRRLSRARRVSRLAHRDADPLGRILAADRALRPGRPRDPDRPARHRRRPRPAVSPRPCRRWDRHRRRQRGRGRAGEARRPVAAGAARDGDGRPARRLGRSACADRRGARRDGRSDPRRRLAARRRRRLGRLRPDRPDPRGPRAGGRPERRRRCPRRRARSPRRAGRAVRRVHGRADGARDDRRVPAEHPRRHCRGE